jgi:hypothetical protein
LISTSSVAIPLRAAVKLSPSSIRAVQIQTLRPATSLPKLTERRSACRVLKNAQVLDQQQPHSKGLSHLKICELEQDLGQEGIVPACLLELSAHGVL